MNVRFRFRGEAFRADRPSLISSQGDGSAQLKEGDTDRLPFLSKTPAGLASARSGVPVCPLQLTVKKKVPARALFYLFG
ncbi:hypothetical protein C6Y45_02380 [Alkalicoccus saliphilus]|uniref:Uncharacterized protein n=1 Tax=Alkalicoccus saliphilus TaxID=200989 RepID=A0A2T4UA24_9BACI|nr:hypothetical protein C6Y45_02380 [Alkalicoccus saliphilus]